MMFYIGKSAVYLVFSYEEVHGEPPSQLVLSASNEKEPLLLLLRKESKKTIRLYLPKILTLIKKAVGGMTLDTGALLRYRAHQLFFVMFPAALPADPRFQTSLKILPGFVGGVF